MITDALARLNNLRSASLLREYAAERQRNKDAIIAAIYVITSHCTGIARENLCPSET